MKLKPCQQCGRCCETLPCALAPEDLPRIAEYLGLTEEQLFKTCLVLDCVESSQYRNCYVAPARKNSLVGTIVEAGWTFEGSPCIFLQEGKCSIDKVKPKGGREFHCSLMTNTNSNQIGYSKKESAQDWTKTNMISQLITLVEGSEKENTVKSSRTHVSTLGSSFTTLPTT